MRFFVQWRIELWEDSNKLEIMAYQNCRFSVSGLRSLLNGLNKFESLRVLRLEGVAVGSHGVRTVANFVKQQKLEALILRSCSLGELGVTQIALVLPVASGSLKLLDLSGNHATEPAGLVLASTLATVKLERLILQENPLSSSIGPIADALDIGGCVQQLSLASTDLCQSETISRMCRSLFLRHLHLTHLDLANNKINGNKLEVRLLNMVGCLLRDGLGYGKPCHTGTLRRARVSGNVKSK